MRSIIIGGMKSEGPEVKCRMSQKGNLSPQPTRGAKSTERGSVVPFQVLE